VKRRGVREEGGVNLGRRRDDETGEDETTIANAGREGKGTNARDDEVVRPTTPLAERT